MSAVPFFSPAFQCPAQRRLSEFRLRAARPRSASQDASSFEYRVITAGLAVLFTAGSASVLAALFRAF